MDGVARAKQGISPGLSILSDLDRRSWGRDQHGVSEHAPQLSRTGRTGHGR